MQALRSYTLRITSHHADASTYRRKVFTVYGKEEYLLMKRPAPGFIHGDSRSPEVDMILHPPHAYWLPSFIQNPRGCTSIFVLEVILPGTASGYLADKARIEIK